MVRLTLFNEDVKENGVKLPIYKFESPYKINIIGGDSGSGKSLLYKNILNALKGIDYWEYKCNKDILIFQDLESFKRELKTRKECLIICDEDTTEVLLKNNLCGMIAKSKNYFLLMDRGMKASIETNVRAMFEISKTDKIYKGIRIYNINPIIRLEHNTNIDTHLFKQLVTEDSESGKVFWENMLTKLNVLDGPYGKSNVPSNVYEALKLGGNVLIALDYDSAILEMLLIIKDKRIDKSRIAFIPMESFEEVLCNSEFILSKFPDMKDKVLNYQNYIDASYKHTGAYFSRLLFDNVKVKSPLKIEGSKNVTKFYDKGMKNFKECFIDDCCKFNCTDCRLYLHDDKKRNMLNNKFEFLQIFM